MLDEKELMDIDNPDENDAASCKMKVNGVALHPVPHNASGVGLPYAPINWPNPGDNWRWKVGKRVGGNGYHRDRYLYTPTSFQKRSFASRLSVIQYLQKEFPGVDVNEFFSSFSWRVPSGTGHEGGSSFKEMEEHFDFESDSDSSSVRCKGRNKECKSLKQETIDTHPAAMPCDLCCNEEDFCRDCCCILCYKPVNLEYGGYSFIKCEAKESEDYICAHMAHLNCALRIYLAGVVGGTIKLDAQYHCRRCDARTDLVPHVTRSIEVCQTINESRDHIEKILTVGICVLRNSERESAKRLLGRIESAWSKLKSGICIKDIWKVEDTVQDISPGALDHSNDALQVTQDSRLTKPTLSEYQIQSLKLEEQIYSALESLKKSQETEYKIAEEVLNGQKNYLITLFEQLDKEKSELTAMCSSSASPEELLEPFFNRMEQIQRELGKFKDMEQVAKGFGKTSEGILKEHFGIDID